jgi:hypothetical protein
VEEWLGVKWNLPVSIGAVLDSCLKKSIGGKKQAISSDSAISLLWRGRCGCLWADDGPQYSRAMWRDALAGLHPVSAWRIAIAHF